jgi:glycosyltransferase involved in cell wall biosynthesis
MPVFNSMSDFERGNGNFLLPHAIQSILEQTFTDFELIILDNISDDATFDFCAELAKTDARIRVLRDSQRRSPEESIFRLIRLATGQFTIIVNDDDKWDCNFLYTLLRFQDLGDYDLVYSNGQYLDMEDRSTGTLTEDDSSIYSCEFSQLSNFCRYIHKRNPFPISFGLFKTEVLNTNYPEIRFHKYRANMDNLFISQFLLSTNKIGFVDEDLFFYRSKSRSHLHNLEFNHNSKVTPDFELFELLEHHSQFSKIISAKIQKSKLNKLEKSFAEIANLNAFINYALRMFNWQLQKPGLSAADFHVVIKVVKMLQTLLSKTLIKSDVDLDSAFDLKNQDKINHLGNKVRLISKDIFEYLDVCLDEFPMNFLKDFDSLLQPHLNNLNVTTGADYSSGLHQQKINSGNLFLLNLKRVLGNSFLYYKYIKSR